VNTSDLPPVSLRAERRGLEIQTKLHGWANDNPHRRFDDLHNLVTEPGIFVEGVGTGSGEQGRALGRSRRARRRLRPGTDRHAEFPRRTAAAEVSQFRAAKRPLSTRVRGSGHWTYLYGAVDQDGQVIDVLISTRSDSAAARAFLARALRFGPSPVEVTTDRAPVYPPVIDELAPAARHDFEQYATDENVKQAASGASSVHSLRQPLLPGDRGPQPLGSPCTADRMGSLCHQSGIGRWRVAAGGGRVTAHHRGVAADVAAGCAALDQGHGSRVGLGRSGLGTWFSAGGRRRGRRAPRRWRIGRDRLG